MNQMNVQEFLYPLLNIAKNLGVVTTKKGFFGDTTVFIDKVKIGGAIKDKFGFIFQFKPTKTGTMILQEYSKQPENFGKHDMSFTFKTLTNIPFLPQLIQSTFEELKK